MNELKRIFSELNFPTVLVYTTTINHLCVGCCCCGSVNATTIHLRLVIPLIYNLQGQVLDGPLLADP